MQNARRKSIVGLGTLLVGALAGLTGCESPERYVYRSEPHLPATVTLSDTLTGDDLLTVDVEPGKQLIMEFSETLGNAESKGSEELRWAVTPWGVTSMSQANRLTVPPPSSRRIDVSYRDPEPRTGK